MKWTDEKPSEEGFYWYRRSMYVAQPTILHVEIGALGYGLVVFSHQKFVGEIDGQWSERIEEPEEPSTIETGIRPIEVYPVGLGSREEPPTMVERKYVDPDLDSGD